MNESGSLLGARVWLRASPWRMVAAWSVCAAILAANVPARLAEVNWRTLLLLVLLADPVWGSIWGLATSDRGADREHEVSSGPLLWLPYLRSGSPAARVLGWDGPGIFSLAFRVAFPSIAVAALVALMLGKAALLMTGALIILSALGWLHRQVRLIPMALLKSLVTVVLPWGLALHYLGQDFPGDFWVYQLTLLGLWGVHTWGGERQVRLPGDRLGLVMLACAQLGIGLLLVMAQSPMWLALLSVLWLPTWLCVYQERPLHQVQFWWLVAMLVSSLAVGQATATP